jgi:hypothetical protein
MTNKTPACAVNAGGSMVISVVDDHRTTGINSTSGSLVCHGWCFSIYSFRSFTELGVSTSSTPSPVIVVMWVEFNSKISTGSSGSFLGKHHVQVVWSFDLRM